ncbi:hypothetical protein MSP8887_00331 [Marinomonas spartinae]|nr:hypothetical protein MSP8887_00331 [Marinomonas spartinae]
MSKSYAQERDALISTEVPKNDKVLIEHRVENLDL